MKVYNKTTDEKFYGFVVPASNKSGELGPVVDVTDKQGNAMGKYAVAFALDAANGNIQVEK
jgi:hypothetical protein